MSFQHVEEVTAGQLVVPDLGWWEVTIQVAAKGHDVDLIEGGPQMDILPKFSASTSHHQLLHLRLPGKAEDRVTQL